MYWSAAALEEGEVQGKEEEEEEEEEEYVCKGVGTVAKRASVTGAR